MSNLFYTATGNPQTLSRESSALMQAEFALIQVAFNTLNNDFSGYTGPILVTGTNAGVVNAYTVTTGRALGAYSANMGIVFTPTITNTGASSINVDSIGTLNILSVSGAALVAGDLVSGNTYLAIYNGTAAQLISVTKNYVDLSVAAEAAIRAANDTTEATTRAAADTAEATTRAAADTAEALARAAAVTAETNRAQAAEALLAPLAGAAFTGPVTVQNPTIAANPATKSYVDAAIYPGGFCPTWVSGQTYTYGQVVFSPINLQNYRHSTASSSLSLDPSADSTNWQTLGSSGASSGKVKFFSQN